jgi:hypothetical protein
MSATGGTTFTTTMWVIYWVHNNTTNRWTTALPAHATSFSVIDIRLLSISY